ncbi:hypothetical protein AB0F72_27640 [Actinoplanes sp. NPDC023936]|uniref:hypothetical protein n=1 Tax=Actinoplanes sp. NPDC023936 TaxID=3154910 RepID=UPI0033F4F421
MLPTERTMSRRGLHVALTAQSVVVILVSVNRLAPITLTPVPPYEFLRLVELNNMVLALFSLIVSYALIARLGAAVPHGASPASLIRGVVFMVGAYLFALSYGNHEVTNYLNARFCPPRAGGEICDIVRFHDDEVSHLLFFAGFTIINLSVMAAQWAHPTSSPLSRSDRVLSTGNGLVVAAGIMANLAFETIGFDLYVVAAVAVTAVVLHLRRPGQLILWYYAIAYPAGFVATLAVKALGAD